MEFPVITQMSEKLASFCEEAILAEYVPKNIQLILYPKSKDDKLFPEHSNRVGFHLRRGGYPTALVPLGESDDGSDYKIGPFVVGHELGEIIYTHMLREEDGSMGPLSLIDVNPLWEGFCDVIGIRFYNYVTREDLDYDGIHQGIYNEIGMPQLLEAQYSSLAEESQKYLEYFAGGSIVYSLVDRYRLKSVLEYFNKCAEALRKEDEEFAAALDDAPILGGVVSVGVTSEFEAQVVDNEHLHGLLKRLGYRSDNFPVVAASTRPLDTRPEGVIATILVDQFHDWFGDGDSDPRDGNNQDASVSQDTDRRRFIDILSEQFYHDIAKEVFGKDFDFDEFIEDWKKKIGDLITE
jgi:hypothetical protein